MLETDSVAIGIYIYYNLPLFSPPYPYPLPTLLAPSLISLAVPVDAKHHRVNVLVVSQLGLNGGPTDTEPEILQQHSLSVGGSEGLGRVGCCSTSVLLTGRNYSCGF